MNDSFHADGGWVLGLIVLCLFATGIWILIRYALPKLRKKSEDFTGSDSDKGSGKNPKPEPKPDPKPEPKKGKDEKAKGSGSWGKMLRMLLLGTIAVVAFCWLVLGGGAAQIAVGTASWFAHVIFDPNLPNTSARQYAQRSVGPSIAIVEPLQVTRVTCTERSLQMLKLTEDSWTDWQDVPRGCAAQVDIPPSTGQYRMECKDLQHNETGTCTEYTAIRFQKTESLEHLPLTLQLWFVPIKI